LVAGEGAFCNSAPKPAFLSAKASKEWLMGSFSIWHWAIVILLIVVLFGRGKISDLMGDVAKGIKSFKRGLAEEDKEDEPKAIPNEMADRSKDSVKDKVAG
jgi:sec-independent protein translocase protein TatA